MPTSAEFWRDQAKWPRDDGQYTFLGRALHAMGRAMFADQWTMDEPLAQYPPEIHFTSDLVVINNFIADNLPQFRRTAYRGSMAPPPVTYAGPDYRPTLTEASSDEWGAIKSRLKELKAAYRAAADRLGKAQESIAGCGVTGSLKTAYRPIAGGAFNSIPADWWRIERLDLRFSFCRIDPSAPFEAGRLAWIFVETAFLDSVLRDTLQPQRTIIGAPTLNNRSRKGQGAFTAVDEPLLDRMEKLIVEREVTSIEAAAKAVADDAKGAAWQSKVTRLAKSYRKSGRRTAP